MPSTLGHWLDRSPRLRLGRRILDGLAVVVILTLALLG
jgi:hypothetical protein